MVNGWYWVWIGLTYIGEGSGIRLWTFKRGSRDGMYLYIWKNEMHRAAS